MKKKQKIVLFFAAAFLLFAAMIVNVHKMDNNNLNLSTAYAQIPEGVGTPDWNEMVCRCKSGGCYGGNWISLRAACAKGPGDIDCSAYSNNCPSDDDED